jgi:hypothetical protein
VAEKAVRNDVSNNGIAADTGDTITLIPIDQAALVLLVQAKVVANATTNAELQYRFDLEGVNLIFQGSINNTSEVFGTRTDTIIQRLTPLYVPSGIDLASKVSIQTADAGESYDHQTKIVYVPLQNNQLP